MLSLSTHKPTFLVFNRAFCSYSRRRARRQPTWSHAWVLLGRRHARCTGDWCAALRSIRTDILNPSFSSPSNAIARMRYRQARSTDYTRLLGLHAPHHPSSCPLHCVYIAYFVESSARTNVLPHMKAYTSASVGSVVFACWEEQAGSCDANSRGRLLVAHVHRWEGVAAMGRVAPRVAGCAHRRLARHAPVPHCAITKEGGARTHQGARSGVRQADRCSSGAKARATWRSHPIVSFAGCRAECCAQQGAGDGLRAY